jgi:hypothetical protein
MIYLVPCRRAAGAECSVSSFWETAAFSFFGILRFPSHAVQHDVVLDLEKLPAHAHDTQKAHWLSLRTNGLIVCM